MTRIWPDSWQDKQGTAQEAEENPSVKQVLLHNLLDSWSNVNLSLSGAKLQKGSDQIPPTSGSSTMCYDPVRMQHRRQSGRRLGALAGHATRLESIPDEMRSSNASTQTLVCHLQSDLHVSLLTTSLACLSSCRASKPPSEVPALICLELHPFIL